ncbi:MAG: hypothetical protein K1X67_01040 [Fimbriimonadaceae bacterium]|nr:hypothetical protein [Fimbriimonadaceae bacterium]
MAIAWHVTSFYRFLTLEPERLDAIVAELGQVVLDEAIWGLVILAPEGINATVASTDVEALHRFKALVCTRLGDDSIRFKDSVSEVKPFRHQNVVRRDEIVTLKRPDLTPDGPDSSHLTPAEWHAMLGSAEPKLLIDTRNRYETVAGKFRGAIDPGLNAFSEWGAYLDRAELPTDVPVMIYCTGGIRCEKAILEMRSRGFETVYQLRDGILGYLAEFPEAEYEGECFVFDDRVALDQHLQPTTRFGICPGCGLTGGIEARCAWCGETFLACDECISRPSLTCCKTCRDRVGRHGARVAP